MLEPRKAFLTSLVGIYKSLCESSRSSYNRSGESDIQYSEGGLVEELVPENFSLLGGATFTVNFRQIIHAQSYNAIGGIISCRDYVDINGQKHGDWIPAIRLQ
jgi:hypothetical protein